MKRRPRKLKKSVRRCIVTMDVQSVPEGWALSDWHEVFFNEGICLWDSRKGGVPPKITPHNKRISIVVKTV
jgi:hypothetical protein